jgi:hypothetical protein
MTQDPAQVLLAKDDATDPLLSDRTTALRSMFHIDAYHRLFREAHHACTAAGTIAH